MQRSVHLALTPSNDVDDLPTWAEPVVTAPVRLMAERPRKGWSFHLARDARVFSEFGALILSLTLSALLFPNWVEQQSHSFLWAGVLWIAVYAVLSVISRDSMLDNQSSRIAQRIGNWSKAAAVLIIFAFAAKGNIELSRLWIAASYVFGCLALTGVILISAHLSTALHRSGSFGDRLAIYGTNGRIEHLVSILREKGRSYQIDSIFDDGLPGARDSVAGIDVGCGLDDLITRAKAGHVDAILLNLPWSEQAMIEQVVSRLEEVNVDVLLVPSELQLARRSLQITRCGPLATIALYQRPMNGVGALLKMVIDRSVAALALIFFGPLLLFIAAAIKLDSPGPALFRQKRCGLNNEPFSLFKFRSMYHHTTDQNADKLVTRNDARVTKLGAFLRRTSLDELPQLINILRGEMSLVGPRPHAYGAKAADRLYEEVVRRYPARHRVLPGLTGLAQVRGYRGNTLREEDIIRRIESDLEYIDRWSLSLDLVIMVRTAITLFFHRQAY
jgi:Undecaprenyl-phosphate glucose phosphotransferase